MLDNIKKYFVVLSFFQFCFLSGALIASDEFREEKRIEQKSSSTTIATDSFLALEELKKNCKQWRCYTTKRAQTSQFC